MAWSLCRRWFNVSTFMVQVSAACTPHTWWVHLTSGQKGQMAVGEKGKQLAELAPCTFPVCDRSQLAATSCREHVPKVAELWDNFKLFVPNLNLWNFSFIYSPSSPKASGTHELRVRAQGSLNATAFLMHPALAANCLNVFSDFALSWVYVAWFYDQDALPFSQLGHFMAVQGLRCFLLTWAVCSTVGTMN